MTDDLRITLVDQQVVAALGALRTRLADPSAVLDEIGRTLVDNTVDRFERGIGPDGEAWTPSERAKREGGQTLVDTARLRGSITHVVSGGAVEIGTNVIYAAIHQLGGTIKPKSAAKLVFRIAGELVMVDSVTIPARPFLGFDETDRDDTLAIIADAFKRAAPGAIEGP